jgi:polysaccharide export outer membrane protein
LLSFAGGPNLDRAGRNIQVVHAAPSPLCEKSSSGREDDEAAGFVSYSLTDIMRGDERSNPYIRPGDIVTIPEAEQIYVVGNVLKPSTIPLKEPISVSMAIAMAGGTLKDTKNDRVRIIRQTPGSGAKTEIYVDLKAIEKRRADDVALQANDIVDVPSSGAKSFLRGLFSTITPSITSLPLRVIP